MNNDDAAKSGYYGYLSYEILNLFTSLRKWVNLGLPAYLMFCQDLSINI